MVGNGRWIQQDHENSTDSLFYGLAIARVTGRTHGVDSLFLVLFCFNRNGFLDAVRPLHFSSQPFDTGAEYHPPRMSLNLSKHRIPQQNRYSDRTDNVLEARTCLAVEPVAVENTSVNDCSIVATLEYHAYFQGIVSMSDLTLSDCS